MLTQEAEAEIKVWFTWWRDRRRTVDELRSTNHPDASILVFAALDAFANWFGAFRGTKKTTHARRFGEMLSQLSGDENFNRVSLPDVWDRAADDLSPPFRSVVERFGKAPDSHEPRLRTFRDDPLMKDVQAEAALSLFLATKVGKSSNLGSEWIHYSRYGEIVYRLYRNTWLHELRPGKQTTAMRENPGYMSSFQQIPPVFDLPVAYMAKVLGNCIDSLEQMAIAKELRPVRLHKATPQDADEGEDVGWVLAK